MVEVPVQVPEQVVNLCTHEADGEHEMTGGQFWVRHVADSELEMNSAQGCRSPGGVSKCFQVKAVIN